MTGLAQQLAEVPDYDAGLLGDFGGGNVDWWQNYIRAEIERANEYWREAIADKLGAHHEEWPKT